MKNIRPMRLGAPGLLLGLSACGSAVPIATYEGPPLGDGRSSLGMPIEGELALDGSCLYVATDLGKILPVWPIPGTEWDADNGTVTLDETTVSLGERVIMGDYIGDEPGPSDDWDGWPDWDAWVMQPPPECEYDRGMVVRFMERLDAD